MVDKAHDPVVFDSPVVDSVVELLDGSVLLGEEHAA
jgi:hypothetical protein